jgi:hypothetical protein
MEMSKQSLMKLGKLLAVVLASGVFGFSAGAQTAANGGSASGTTKRVAAPAPYVHDQLPRLAQMYYQGVWEWMNSAISKQNPANSQNQTSSLSPSAAAATKSSRFRKDV